VSAGVPAYFHPEREATDWARLRARVDREGAGIVVVNPDTGPGSGDPAYRAAVCGLNALVAGYVDTAYATRAPDDVRADAAAYRDLHGVTAVFLDRVTSGPEGLPYYRALDLPGPVLLNPGVRPDPGYFALAEVVVTFEGDHSAYSLYTTPEPSACTWHLVHGVPPAEHATVLRRAERLGATHAYVTDRKMPNPWDGLPASWPA
jgi:hypothetical protein